MPFDATFIANWVSALNQLRSTAKAAYSGKLTQTTQGSCPIDFDWIAYNQDRWIGNQDLRQQLSTVWKADPSKRGAIANWIVKDWGGVSGNKDATMASFIKEANEAVPKFKFNGIATYSKIMSIVDPNKFAIFDARVGASLNLFQYKLGFSSPQYFPIPASENANVKKIRSTWTKHVFKSHGFKAIENRNCYRQYNSLLTQINEADHDLRPLETETILFSLGPSICAEYLPKTVPVKASP